MKTHRNNGAICFATALLGLVSFVAIGCSGSSSNPAQPPAPATYTVTYDGNSSTGGSVPVDTAKYTAGSTVTVLGNTGSLAKTGFGFSGWNTLSNSAGTAYAPPQTFAMGAANVTLYASWAQAYTVTYDGNGSTGGSVPVDTAKYTAGSTVTVQGNTGNLAKTGYGFSGWNTLSNSTGTAYAAAQTFAMGAANATLYAAWVQGPPPAGPKYFAYVANAGSNNVSAYSIDASTGALTALTGSPFPAGSFPQSVTIDPTGKFAYVANGASNSVSAYAMDASTGAMTAIPSSPFAAGTGPISVTVDPTGKFAYVVNHNSDNVSAYRIDASTGALTAITGSPFAAGSMPSAVTTDPTGKFAYVVNVGGGVVYTINASTGALSATGGITPGSNPVSVTTDPTGKFAYVANYVSNDVSAYTINATTGALTAITGSPFAAGTYPYSVTVDPAGKFAYVANASSGNVSAYRIDASTGALTAITGSPFAAGTAPRSVTVDPTGKFAYVTNAGSKNVSAYTIDASTGALTTLPNSPFAAGTSPWSIITVKKN